MTFPKGRRLVPIILKCCRPQGMPTMVMQKIQPKKRCISAISHQPSTIHKRFINVYRHPELFGPSTNSWPKGHRAKAPSLNSCTPKGIPMMVMHRTSPQKKYIIAIKRPPNISQSKFPSVFIYDERLIISTKVVARREKSKKC